MKKILASIFIALITATGVNAQKHTYQLNVGAFDKLCISDNVNVEYRCLPDSVGYIAFEGEEEFADAFIFSNSKGKLKVQVNTEDVDNPNLPVLRVYSNYLSEVENGSSFTTTLINKLSVPVISLKVIGNGKIIVHDINANEVTAAIATGSGIIDVRGKCDIANFKMLGVGDINGEKLDARIVKCNILGTGQIFCDAEDKLEIKGIGSTRIYYAGNPEIKKRGGGKLIPLNEKKD